jgi:hypothetical protein
MYSTNLSTSAATPQSFGVNFILSSLAPYAAYCSIFDQYAIVQAVVRIQPMLPTFAAGTGPGALVTAIDHDDSTAFTTKAQAQAFTTALETIGSIGQTRVIQPRVAVAAYSGSVFTAFANQRTYIDCASPSVPHYGLKVFFDASTTVVVNYSVDVELFVHFRDNRN